MGGFCIGDGTRLWPVSPHNLVLGAMHDNTAGLVGVGDAGKLMGLAPYGEPRFFEQPSLAIPTTLKRVSKPIL